MDKSEIRKKILRLRDEMDPDVRIRSDALIRERIMSLIYEKKADCILTYVSFRSEADTHMIIDECLKAKIKVAVPKVYGRKIVFRYIGSRDDLRSGYMGIPEPGDDLPEWDQDEVKKTVMLVPGAVFDSRNMRCGYGGGFYDRFLEDHPDICTVGICYGIQLIDELNCDEWDRAVDMVITDR